MRRLGEPRKRGSTTAETGPEIDQKLLLVVSEICEAQNELRQGHEPTEVYYPGAEMSETDKFGVWQPDVKPEGFGVELADAIIRIVQLGRSLGLDLDALVAEKMAYNATRPFKHGKKF